MSEHTPGPWFTCPQGAKPHNYALVGIGNGTVHVGYASVTPALSLCEADANARIIAAAPELLSACKALSEAAALLTFDTTHVPTDTLAKVGPAWDAARAAIAKAEGRA